MSKFGPKELNYNELNFKQQLQWDFLHWRNFEKFAKKIPILSDGEWRGRRAQGRFLQISGSKKEKDARMCVLFFLERGRKSLATKQFSVSAISWHGRELGAAPHAFPRSALPWR